MKEKVDGQKNDKETTVIVNGDMGIVYDEGSINLTCHTSDWVIDLGSSFNVYALMTISHHILMLIMAMFG